jgi:hypothetical protein
MTFTKLIETLRHRLLGPLPDAAQVVRVGERHHAHAVCLRALDGDVGRFEPDHLAVARLAVERDQRAAVEFDLRMAVRLQAALLQRLDVARDHADAVRVVAGEVGGDEVLGDEARFARVAAAGGDDRLDGARERRGLKDVGAGHRGRSL